MYKLSVGYAGRNPAIIVRGQNTGRRRNHRHSQNISQINSLSSKQRVTRTQKQKAKKDTITLKEETGTTRYNLNKFGLTKYNGLQNNNMSVVTETHPKQRHMTKQTKADADAGKH